MWNLHFAGNWINIWCANISSIFDNLKLIVKDQIAVGNIGLPWYPVRMHKLNLCRVTRILALCLSVHKYPSGKASYYEFSACPSILSCRLVIWIWLDLAAGVDFVYVLRYLEVDSSLFSVLFQRFMCPVRLYLVLKWKCIPEYTWSLYYQRTKYPGKSMDINIACIFPFKWTKSLAYLLGSLKRTIIFGEADSC